MKAVLLVASALALLAACGQGEDPTAKAATGAEAGRPDATFKEPSAQPTYTARKASTETLAARMDCVREAKAALVQAHRGGSTRDYPENALETLQRTFDAGSVVLEIDVSQAADGTLFLMHDDTLDRTTSGTGDYSKMPYAQIAKLTLKTYRDDPTPYHPPKLSGVLAWAKKTGAVLELDKKRQTPLAPILAAIKEADATRNAMVITYTDAQAVEAHKGLPGLYIAATVDDMDHYKRLIGKGVDKTRLLAWTGNTTQNPALWTALAAEGVEVSFGTAGERGKRFDDSFWDDNDGAEYDGLAADGVQIISTDLSDKVNRAMATDDKARQTCGF